MALDLAMDFRWHQEYHKQQKKKSWTLLKLNTLMHHGHYEGYKATILKASSALC